MSKKQQRTKGNLKAASSSKAVELLNSSGFSQTEFVGFADFTPSDGSPQQQKATSEEFFSAKVDGDLRTYYRRMMKKDGVTKLKALKQLLEYLDEKSDAEVCSAFECWPRTFSKLSMDGNFKVRQLSQEVMGVFGVKLGKRLESSIKTIFPYWLLGLTDPYREVSSVARNGLDTTIPGQKQTLATTLCQTEIINICAELLLGNPMDQLKKLKDEESPEETADCRQNRLSRCALLLLEHTTISIDGAEELQKLGISLEKHIWSVPKFWKVFWKHRDVGVKTAWFRALRAWCSKFGDQLMQNYSKPVLTAIVNSLEDTDKNLCSAVWDSWLLCLKMSDEKVWLEVNVEKALLPKLNAILRKGCSGLAGAIGPCLLPILSRIPSEASTAPQIYGKWTGSLLTGLEGSVSSDDKSNTEALALALEDCSRFIVPKLLEFGCVDAVQDILETKVNPAVLMMMRSELLSQRAVSLLESMEKISQKHTEIGICVSDLIGKFGKFDSLQNVTQRFTGIFVAEMMNSELQQCNSVGHAIFGVFWRDFVENPTVKGLGFLAPFEQRRIAVFSDKPENHREYDGCKERLLAALHDVDYKLAEQLIPVVIAVAGTEKMARIEEISKIEKAHIYTSLFLFVLQKCEEDGVSSWCTTESFKNLWLKCVKTAMKSPVESSRWLPTFLDCLNSERKILNKDLFRSTLCSIAEQVDVLSKTWETELILIEVEPGLQIMSQIAAALFKNDQDVASSRAGLIALKEFVMVYSIMLAYQEGDKKEQFSDNTITLYSHVVTAGVENLLRPPNSDSISDLLKTLAVDIRAYILREQRSLAQIEGFVKAAVKLFDLIKTETAFVEFLREFVSDFNTWRDTENLLNFDWRRFALAIPEIGLLTAESPSFETAGDSVSGEFQLTQVLLFLAKLLVHPDLLDQVIGFRPNNVVCVLRACYGYAASFLVQLEYSSDWPSKNRSDTLSSVLHFIKSRTDYKLVQMMLYTAADSASELQLFGLELALELLQKQENASVLMYSTERSEFCNVICARADDSSEITVDEDLALLSRQIFSKNTVEVEANLVDFLSRKSEFEERLLFCINSVDVPWTDFLFNIQLIKVLCKLSARITVLDSVARDFLLCSLITWLQSCAELAIENSREAIFVSLVCRLFNLCAREMEGIAETEELEPLRREWEDFFLDGCSAVITPLMLRAINKSDKLNLADGSLVLKEVCEAVSHVPDSHLKNEKFPLLLDPDLDEKKYPGDLQSMILNCVPMILDENRCVQISGYRIMKRFMKDVSEVELKIGIEEDKDSSSSEDISSAQDDREKKPPGFLLSALAKCYDKISKFVISSGHKDMVPEVIGDLLGFFLLWDLVLDFCDSVETGKRPEYSTFLRSSMLLENLILTLFCVMPENVENHDFEVRTANCAMIDCFEDALKLTGQFDSEKLARSKKETELTVFTTEPTLTYRGNRSLCSAELDSLSCRVFYRLLTIFPAAVRQWRNSQNKNLASMIENFVVRYVSPLLLKQEFGALAKSKKKFENMTIVGRPNAREVIACYTMDELCMELVVELPQNYPLGQPSVSVNQRVGIPQKNWRRWMLQLTVFLAHQNGSVLDGLLLWKSNVDKHLEGVEDCMICMMAVHVGNYSLPKIQCKQCKKKFHASCLYKWFNSSNSTSCPLCRRSF